MSDVDTVLFEKITEVSLTVAHLANVGAMETAGMIVSVLHANPDLIDRFMDEGSGMIVDGTICVENGGFSYHSIGAGLVTPKQLRESRGCDN